MGLKGLTMKNRRVVGYLDKQIGSLPLARPTCNSMQLSLTPIPKSLTHSSQAGPSADGPRVTGCHMACIWPRQIAAQNLPYGLFCGGLKHKSRVGGCV